MHSVVVFMGVAVFAFGRSGLGVYMGLHGGLLYEE
jgi:hypothetical protein